MFKSLWLITSLSVTLTALIAEVAFGVPSHKQKPSLEAKQELAQFGNEVPLCYIQTSDGKVLDLTNLCKEQAQSGISASNVNVARPAPSPYNNSAIKKFDDELYGEGN